MLSSTSRTEVLNRIQLAVGFPIYEEMLSPATRLAITNLSTVQRHLSVLAEVLGAENARVDDSAILRLASKVRKGPDSQEREKLAVEVASLQKIVDAKVIALSKQVIAEETARHSGAQPPPYPGKAEPVQLKCPQCAANLPFPTARLVKCQYCGSTLSVPELSSQMGSAINGI